MMAVIEAILAVIGLVLLILFVVAWNYEPTPEPQQRNHEPDVAAPYRDALLAAARLQQAAQEAEQQMYAEAARNIRVPSATSSTPIRRRDRE